MCKSYPSAHTMALTLTRIVVKFIDVAEVEYSDIVKIDTSRSANEQKKTENTHTGGRDCCITTIFGMNSIA